MQLATAPSGALAEPPKRGKVRLTPHAQRRARKHARRVLACCNAPSPAPRHHRRPRAGTSEHPPPLASTVSVRERVPPSPASAASTRFLQQHIFPLLPPFPQPHNPPLAQLTAALALSTLGPSARYCPQHSATGPAPAVAPKDSAHGRAFAPKLFAVRWPLTARRCTSHALCRGAWP